MEIKDKDLGKIVQLPVRPEWGLGVITKLEPRFAHIRFKVAGEKTAKKYFRAENPLVLAKDQDRANLAHKARTKDKKIKTVLTKPEQP